MKFKFKVQQYQTDAVESTVAVFNGQKNYEHSTYLRDMGEKYRRERANELKFSDEDATTGYRNHALELTDIELLDNIRKIQGANNIMLSQSLVKQSADVRLILKWKPVQEKHTFTSKLCLN